MMLLMRMLVLRSGEMKKHEIRSEFGLDLILLDVLTGRQCTCVQWSEILIVPHTTI